MSLCAQACELLAQLPFTAWAIHIGGTLTFFFVLLHHWVLLRERGPEPVLLVQGTLWLSIFFTVMKGCQAQFSQHLLVLLMPKRSVPKGLAKVKMCLHQGAHHSIGLLTLPIAASMVVPTVWVYSYFQYLTVYGAEGFSPCRSKAASQALKNSWLTHVISSWMFTFALLVFLNVFSFCVALPYLLKILLNVETIFTRGNIFVYFNSTFLITTVFITYILVDPIIKGVYTVMAFKDNAEKSGDDLLGEWRRIKTEPKGKRLSLLMVILLLFCPAAMASPSDGQVIQERLNEILQQDVYKWRREVKPGPKLSREEMGWIEGFFEDLRVTVHDWGKWLKEALDELGRWLEGRDRPTAEEPESWISGGIDTNLLLVLLLGLTVSAVVILILRYRRQAPPPKLKVSAPAAMDLKKEQVDVRHHKPNQWLELVEEQIDAGNTRLALRAIFLSTLSILDQRGAILYSPDRINREYLRELTQHPETQLLEVFSALLKDYEWSWYGDREFPLSTAQTWLERVKELNPEDELVLSP